MAASGLHISISAEPVAHLGGLAISNSMLTSLIVSGLLIAFAVAVRLKLSSTSRPKGLQNVAEWIVESLYGLVRSVANTPAKTNQFFPLVATFFLFIMMNNYFGLLPGVGTIGFFESEGEVTEEHASQIIEPVTASEHQTDQEAPVDVVAEESHGAKFVPYFRAGTADLNTTLALALISMFSVQLFGVKYLKLNYFKKFVNFSNPINFFVGILETVSEFAKIVSFAFRLFGNIFAGEVLLAVITFLVPLVAPMPFYGLEFFIGFIQALVFSMLSLVFYNMATISHDEH